MTIVSDEADRSLEGILVTKPVDERLTGQTEAHSWTGRFTCTRFLSKDDEGSRQHVDAFLSEDSFNRALRSISSRTCEISGATTTYTAEIGETRFETESGAYPRPCGLSELATLVDFENPLFEHVGPGLAHLLLHKTPVLPSSRKNSILGKSDPVSVARRSTTEVDVRTFTTTFGRD